MSKIVIVVECGECEGTGVYHGFAEPEGVGVVCLACKGSGKRTLKYKSFIGRRVRHDIKTVQRSRGWLIGTGIGPVGGSITYQEFLKGKMPK